MYFLDKPLREQVAIQKPMNPSHAKKIILEVSKECYDKYIYKKETEKKLLMNNITKAFINMIKSTKEKA